MNSLLSQIKARRPHIIVVAGPLDAKAFWRVAPGRTCVAVNRGLWLGPWAFSHYVSYHSDDLLEIQRSWQGVTWTQRPALAAPKFSHLVDNLFSGGSSGLFGISVALQYLGATQVILTGVTLSTPGYEKYRDCWRSHKEVLRGCVVAETSGWVKDFLEGRAA